MIKGVNLGGWLVLEKWITPEVFVHTTAEDEYDLYQELSSNEIENRLQVHRDTFITEKDFQKIAELHCDVIRLPVPYSVFDHMVGRKACISYVDKAFEWAENNHLKILIDLHTVPGGQNGMDNGGICGLCTWHMKEENVALTLEILVALATRYRNSDALFGIEPVNEPIDEKTFKGMTYTMNKRYQSNIELSQAVPTEFLKSFYEQVYKTLTPILKDKQKLVFHDGFRLHEWNDFMPQEQYPNVWFDTHLYLNFAKYTLKQKESFNYISYLYETFLPALQEAKEYHPIIVGEWTIAHTPKDCESMTEEMQTHYYRGSASLQEMVFAHAHGWMYFNYRVSDTSRSLWDFTSVIEENILIL